MEFAARGGHLGGIPRKLTIFAVGSFAKVMTTLLNNTSVHNGETLLHLVRSRPLGVPLLTVSNHMSTYVSLSLPVSLIFFITFPIAVEFVIFVEIIARKT